MNKTIYVFLILPLLVTKVVASSDFLEIKLEDSKGKPFSERTLSTGEEFNVVIKAGGPKLEGGSAIVDAGDIFLGFLFFNHNQFDFIELVRADGRRNNFNTIFEKLDFLFDPSFDRGFQIKRISTGDIDADAYGSAQRDINYFGFGVAYHSDNLINICETLYKKVSKDTYPILKNTEDIEIDLKDLSCVGYVVGKGIDKNTLAPGSDFPGNNSVFSVPLAKIKLKAKKQDIVTTTSLIGVASTIGYGEIPMRENTIEVTIDPSVKNESRVRSFFENFFRSRTDNQNLESGLLESQTPPETVSVDEPISSTEPMKALKMKEEMEVKTGSEIFSRTPAASEQSVEEGAEEDQLPPPESQEQKQSILHRIWKFINGIISNILSIF